MDIEIILTISESPGTDVQRHDGLHHVSGSHANDRHITTGSFRYESGVGCMRILNVHIIAVVMREVFQGAASRVVRGMCSVVLEVMVFSLSSDLVDWQSGWMWHSS